MSFFILKMTSYPSIKNGEDGMVYTLEHKEGKDEWISTKTKIDDWDKGKNYYPTRDPYEPPLEPFEPIIYLYKFRFFL